MHNVTVESARRALELAKSHHVSRGAQTGESAVRSSVAPADGICATCERNLENCEECAATGLVDGDSCDVCNGAQRGCPVHHAEWDVPTVAG
ncbi:hypothetical protein HNP40_000265 [Mycobacteroides chelonae]|nr:hypothetical protein [Mycobacteroides chelonae]